MHVLVPRGPAPVLVAALAETGVDPDALVDDAQEERP
jgi:hypothetical protein